MNVLVELEILKSCEECPFAYMTEGVSHDYCKYVGYETDIEDFVGSRCNERPRWCPFNNTETLRVLGEPSQCDPRHTEIEDRAYVSLAAREESEAAAKHDYNLKKELRIEKAKKMRRSCDG